LATTSLARGRNADHGEETVNGRHSEAHGAKAIFLGPPCGTYELTLMRIVLLLWLLSGVLSAVAATEAPRGRRWPMQWGLNGKPTWYAHRLVGATFAFLTTSLTLATWLLVAPQRSPGEGALRTGVALAIVVFGLAIQLFHWYAARRHVRGQGPTA
jgi:uncharacterized BrkB/YihY/UPF0761 family membrane protein